MMIKKKTWEEFRNSGLLWFINTILHTFGWAIVVELEKEKIINCYPARVKFRGFDEKTNTKGYEQVTTFLNDNITDLMQEIKNDDE